MWSTNQPRKIMIFHLKIVWLQMSFMCFSIQFKVYIDKGIYIKYFTACPSILFRFLCAIPGTSVVTFVLVFHKGVTWQGTRSAIAKSKAQCEIINGKSTKMLKVIAMAVRNSNWESEKERGRAGTEIEKEM